MYAEGVIGVFSTLTDSSMKFGSKLAIDGSAKMTYLELEKSSRQIAGYLEQKGIKSGSLVILDIPEPLNTAFEWACWYFGAAPCDYSDSANYDFANDKFLITTASKTSKMPTIGIDGPTLGLIAGSEPLSKPEHQYKQDDVVQVLLSSGTTGKPKPILISAKHLLERARLGEKAWAKQKPVISTMTKGTVAWSNYKLFTIMNGETIIVSADKETLFEMLSKYGVRSMMASPISLKAILDHADATGQKLENLKEIYVGGGVTPDSLAERAMKIASLNNIYGSTESGSISVTEFRKGSKSVGVPFEDVESEIVDENNNALPSGEEGILRYRRPTISTETSSVWFYPGDLARINQSSELEILGRISESVSVGGVKVNLNDLDIRFQEIKELEDLASFSFEQTDEVKIGVAVVSQQSFDPKQISTRLFELSTFPRISAVFQVAEIPRNQNGKIQRNKLRELFELRSSSRS